uniref:Uncharacterized protein n=1 Tax=Clandestinovirus TaxID=2831644 RepID=A0A8F8KL54_9VIRU|nr:hypothetical protein KOM_12_435 [Clandestinovirus]
MEEIEEVIQKVAEFVTKNEGFILYHDKVSWIKAQLAKIRALVDSIEIDRDPQEMCGDCYHLHTTCNVMVSNYGYGEKCKDSDSDIE